MSSKNMNSFPSGKRVLWNEESEKWKGIYVRVNAKKSDMTFYISYMVDRKSQMEKVGKASEGMTAKKAKDLRSDILTEIRRGDHILQTGGPSGDETIMDVWKKFERENLSDRVNYHRPKFENHIQPYFKAKPLVTIDESVLAMMRKHFLEKTTLAAGTIVQIFDTLKALLKLGHSAGMMERVPEFKNLVIEDYDNERERYLNPDKGEVAKFFELVRKHSKGMTTYAMCRLSLVSGMRQGEILKLRGMWVDLENQRVELPGYYKDQRITKNGKPRTVFFDDTMRELLDKEGCRKNDKLVFTTRADKAIYKANVKRVVDKAAKSFNGAIREKLEEARELFKEERITAEELRGEEAHYRKHALVFHSLRHTFATIQVSKGVPLDIVGERLGHRSEKMYRRYAKFIPKSAQDYQEVLHEVISEAGV
jgi:integrase